MSTGASPNHKLSWEPETADGECATPPGEERARDSVGVDKKTCSVGETVMVTWEINTHPPHQQDFIGMFEVARADEVDGRGHTMRHVTAQRLLDSRVRGDTSAYGGCLHWDMIEDLFPKRKRWNLLVGVPVLSLEGHTPFSVVWRGRPAFWVRGRPPRLVSVEVFD